MTDVLGKIFAESKERFAAAERQEPYAAVRERALRRAAERRPFLAALRAADGHAIVAEVKRASPSAGLIARNFDAAQFARAYDAGADAISVLTEPDYFLGDLAYLDVVRSVSRLPILRKDFLASRYAIAQSAAYGADCVLLIVAALDDESLQACTQEASAYDLDALVEVHDEQELSRALAAGAQLIGVNNRDLRTLQTDLATSELLLPQVPDAIFAISESGMHGIEDLLRVRTAGARGFLIGESLVRAADPAETLRELRACLTGVTADRR
jgi:indole-3-glycerol phosphate synthase